MKFYEIFFLGFFFENIFVWHAVGLGLIVLFSYTLYESFWVSIRFIIFLLIQTIIIILLRPFFEFPGKELFLLIILIGFEMILTVFIDVLLPDSYLENTVSGFIKRGDAILPLAFSIIIDKQLPPLETMTYSLGLGLGFAVVLSIITAISIKFNFHRLHVRHTYMLKLFILGIIALTTY